MCYTAIVICIAYNVHTLHTLHTIHAVHTVHTTHTAHTVGGTPCEHNIGQASEGVESSPRSGGLAPRTPTLSKAVLIVIPRPCAAIGRYTVSARIRLCTSRIRLLPDHIGVLCLSLYHFLVFFCIFLLCWSSLGHKCHFPKKSYFHVICNDLSVPPLQLSSNEAGTGPRCASLYQTIFVPRQYWLLGKLKVYHDEIQMDYVWLRIRYMVVFQRLGLVPWPSQ